MQLDSVSYRPGTEYEVFTENESLHVNLSCDSIQTSHSLRLKSLTNQTSEASFYLPLSAFSFEYPVFHCVMHEPCMINSIQSMPPNCSLAVRGSLPPGFTLYPNGTLLAVPEVMGKETFEVVCEDSNYETFLTILVSGIC